MGKGSGRRPKQITSAEEDLRWALFGGAMTLATFVQRYNKLKQDGLLRRSGRVLK